MQTNDTELKNSNSLSEQSSSEEMEFDLLEMIYHLVDKLPQILIVGAVCAVLMGCWSAFLTPQTYEATAKLYVVNANSSIVNLESLQLGNYLANDYLHVFSNVEIHDQVKEKLGLDYEYKALDKMIKINNPSNTRILEITITSTKAREALKMVEAYADAAQLFIEDRMDSRPPEIFEHAILKGEVPKHTLLKMVIAFVLGALVMMTVDIIRFITDDRITTSEFIEKRVGLVTLGMMPVVDWDGSQEDRNGRKHKKAASNG